MQRKFVTLHLKIYISPQNPHMKHLFTLFLSVILGMSGVSQIYRHQSALDFDGIDDELHVSNAANSLAGSSAATLAGWVYLRNAAPSFPDFDGIAGFRNETDADFYLLHLGPDQIEARFRNESGIEYTIVSTGTFQLNTWQHLALTYDGSKLRFWVNGAAVDSMDASGAFGSSGGEFMAGTIDFQTFSFRLDGKLDDIAAWNTALSASQLQCLINGTLPLDQTGMVTGFAFNEGMPEGDNTSISSPTPEIGLGVVTWEGLALNGTASNYVNGMNPYTLVPATLCGGPIIFSPTVITEPGTYYRRVFVDGSCDSLIALQVVDGSLDTSLTQTGTILIANQNNASYQWINCSTGNPINGATNQSYLVQQNGTYAVVMTLGACTDTSECRTINSVGLEQITLPFEYAMFPNPAQHSILVAGIHAGHPLRFSVYNMQGQVLLSHVLKEQTPISLSDFAKGIYWVKFEDDFGVQIKPLVIQ